VWKNTHVAIENLLGDGEPDRLRKNLRAIG
jgi:hypothetical protein